MEARALHVSAAVVVFVSAAGFVGGIRGTAADAAKIASAPRPAPSVVSSARSYADERDHRYGPNAAMYDGVFERMAFVDVNAAVEKTDADRAAAIAKRASRRAYDGAPPTIPHRILQMGPLDCTACHGTGVKIGTELLAPKMSHQPYTSCTQCHVVKVDPRLDAPKVPTPETTFVGVAWGKGTRAWPGAPPTIPHPTAMRPDCSSCHGPLGAVGLKTPHPYRQSCTQCHVADASNDQHAPANLGANLGPGGALP